MLREDIQAAGVKSDITSESLFRGETFSNYRRVRDFKRPSGDENTQFWFALKDLASKAILKRKPMTYSVADEKNKSIRDIGMAWVRIR